MATPRPFLAFTQGDPAGVGPELLLGLLERSLTPPSADPEVQGREAGLDASGAGPPGYRPLLIAERAALAAANPHSSLLERLFDVSANCSRRELEALPGDAIPLLDPVASTRQVVMGRSTAADAGGALVALDTGITLARSGVVDALVTAPVSKESIARQVLPGFVGHTEHLAAACGLERYGRDYLMAFLSPELQVTLLSTHLPLRAALDLVTPENLLAALRRLAKPFAPHEAIGADPLVAGKLRQEFDAGRIAVAGFNPHAGEGGLLGIEDGALVAPAVAAARAEGLDVIGPESADSLFARARGGEVDWVLALYHDQGLIAVKTLGFGSATNWTLGLPFLRTSVDHGTAFAIAGKGVADVAPLAAVVETTLDILTGRSPRRRNRPSF